jgi:RNA recognition motif-containing protein
MEKRSALLFSNVPSHWSEENLQQWIEFNGFHVGYIRLICDRVSGTSPSFAYVDLSDDRDLNRAAEVLNGQRLQGRSLRVKRVIPPQLLCQRHAFVQAE